jgi:hypothetical protein
MNLKELSEAELMLLSQVGQVHGLMEENPYKVDEQGIFDKYIEIHKTYADLADMDDEALKRALFIQWYAISEPSGLTGIPGGQGPFDGDKELNKKAEIKVIRLIEEKIKKKLLDDELKWMLSYYGSWDYYFVQFKDIENIIKFIKKRNTQSRKKQIYLTSKTVVNLAFTGKAY